MITIEPRPDSGEDPWAARPFLMQPYANPIGEGPPDDARTIEYQPDAVPRGIVRVGSDG